MHTHIIATSVLLAFFLPAAQAALFDISYTTSGGDVIEAVVDGTLQGDNNTVVVSSVLDFATINGGNGPSLPFVDSYDDFVGFGSADPVFTLDGSFMDLFVCTDSSCTADGFGFGVGNSVASVALGYDFYAGGGVFFASPEAWDPGNWSMTAQSQVPIPATLPLLLIGAAGLAVGRRVG